VKQSEATPSTNASCAATVVRGLDVLVGGAVLVGGVDAVVEDAALVDAVGDEVATDGAADSESPSLPEHPASNRAARTATVRVPIARW
jgi:hypothetical protein